MNKTIGGVAKVAEEQNLKRNGNFCVFFLWVRFVIFCCVDFILIVEFTIKLSKQKKKSCSITDGLWFQNNFMQNTENKCKKQKKYTFSEM